MHSCLLPNWDKNFVGCLSLSCFLLAFLRTNIFMYHQFRTRLPPPPMAAKACMDDWGDHTLKENTATLDPTITTSLH